MTHKIIKLLVCLIIVLRLFISSALAVIPVHANPAIAIGLGAEALGWGAVGSAGGAKLNYTQNDFLEFGHIDVNGKLVIDDLEGVKTKIKNDYTALAQKTQETCENQLIEQIKDYTYKLHCAEINSEGLSNYEYYQKCLESAEINYNLALQDVDVRLANGEITAEKAIFEKNNLIAEHSLINDIGSSAYQTIVNWIGSNMSLTSPEEMSKLELNAAQINAFSDFIKSAGSDFVSGNITVSRGIQLIAGDLDTIKFPRDVTMYCTPVVSEPYEIVEGKLGYYTFTFNFDSSHNLHRLVYDITSGQLVWEGLSGNIYYNHDYLYYQYAQNNIWISCGTRGPYPFYPLSTTKFILSPSIPVVKDDKVEMPVTVVPVTAVDAITTTFPNDASKRIPVAVPIPTVDTMVGDLVDSGSIPGDVSIPIPINVPVSIPTDTSIPIDDSLPIDIPITFPVPSDIDTDLPDLSIPVSITNKFPFCLPFDLYRGVKVLVAPPVVPSWHVPIKIPVAKVLGGGEVDMSFDIDFNDYELLGTLSRWFFTLLFTFGLIFVTPKVVKGAGN